MHGGQRFAVDRTDKLTVDYLDYRRKHFSILMRQIVFALFMQAIASTVLLGLGGWLVISQELTLGQLVAAELIVTVIVGAFAKLGKHMESYYDLMASVDKVGNLLDLPMEQPGGHVQIDAAGPARIEMKGVSVAVEGHVIVDNFSGVAAEGGMTLVSGRAGSGKSLLLDAIASRRKILSGTVEIDGHDISQLDHETLRQQIGFARDVEVFHGSLAENVHLYRPQIRSNDVRDALQLVGLLDEVRGLSEGLDTILDSDAKPLSRTQALRLMIARAIVGRPRILILDGTLDSLPDGVGYELMDRLTEQPQPWSLIVASGRQSIRNQASEKWDLGSQKLSGV
jgi:ABC-type bacteriocin/lantibiotic exporter with double-glycine peptidase domain